MYTKEELYELTKKSRLTRLQFNKQVVCFEYIDRKDKIFILANRYDNKDIAGFLALKLQENNYFLVEEYNIFESYQNEGIGTDMFIKIVKNGNKIMSKQPLSNVDLVLWPRLRENLNVFIIGDEFNTNDYRILSSSITNRNYIAQSNQHFPEELMRHTHYSEYEQNTEIWFQKWLKGEKKCLPFSCDLYATKGEY